MLSRINKSHLPLLLGDDSANKSHLTHHLLGVFQSVEKLSLYHIHSQTHTGVKRFFLLISSDTYWTECETRFCLPLISSSHGLLVIDLKIKLWRNKPRVSGIDGGWGAGMRNKVWLSRLWGMRIFRVNLECWWVDFNTLQIRLKKREIRGRSTGQFRRPVKQLTNF